MIRKILFFICFFTIALAFSSLAQGIKDRFKGEEKLLYNIYFNGIPSGTMQWQYLGKDTVDGKVVDALGVDSDTSILFFLNLEGKEKVFLDSQSHLPLKVQRDIVVFGKKEIIEEIYNQEEGYIKITKSGSKKEERILQVDTPIHNILSLIYFFPKDIELKKDTELTFNLPTQKLKIRMDSFKELSTNGEKRKTYFLKGSGAKRFNLWLDEQERIPLKLEFLSVWGKLIITKAPKDQVDKSTEDLGVSSSESESSPSEI